MFSNHFLLDHQPLALRWTMATDGLSEIITTHGTYLSNLTPMELLEKLSDTVRVVLQTAPSDHIDCVWILNGSFKTKEVEDYLTDIVFNDRTSVSVPVSKSYIDQKYKSLHSFMYNESHLNYLFPCIKEFNQYYYSSE